MASRFYPCLLLLAAAPAAAQRVRLPCAWQGREAALEYNVVGIGKHTLGELPVGSMWRLGKDGASTIRTPAPLVGGDGMIPPGLFPIALQRAGESEFALFADGAGAALGGREVTYLAGKFSQVDKPGAKLSIEWSPDPQKTDAGPNLETLVRVRYGPYVVVVPITVLGARALKLPGWEVLAFTVPAEVLEHRQSLGVPVVVAHFRKTGGARPRGAPAAWNLVFEELTWALIPVVDELRDDRIVPPAKAFVRTGGLTWSEGPRRAFLEMTRLERDGDAAKIELAAGTQVAKLYVALP
jgi:hypothetical protein